MLIQAHNFPPEIWLQIASNLPYNDLLTLLQGYLALISTLPRHILYFNDGSGDTLLHDLAGKGIATLVSLILSRNILTADTKNNAGRTPLAVACMNNELEVVKLLFPALTSIPTLAIFGK
ncbi:hypothetical protein BJX64DRAFT_292936 [Aspergillus heterothallicus]